MTANDNRRIAEDAFENDIRAGVILHLGSMCADEGYWADEAKEVFQYEDVWGALELEEAAEGDDYFENCTELLVRNKKLGFLVQFSTPLPRPVNGGYICSWGIQCCAWIYGETYQEAFDKALRWAKETVDKSIKEFEGANK